MSNHNSVIVNAIQSNDEFLEEPQEEILEETEEEDIAEAEEDFTVEERTFTAEEREAIFNDITTNVVGKRNAKAPIVDENTGKIKEQLQWKGSETAWIDNKLKETYHIKDIHHTYDFDKNVNMWAKVPSFKKPFITGYCMYVADTKLICIDFDIDKALPYNQRLNVRNKLLKKLINMVRRPDLLMFDFSANGGFHVWLRNDVPNLVALCQKDRSIKFYEASDEEHLDIDIFVPKAFPDAKVAAGVVLPYSIINTNAGKSETPKYRCYTMPKTIPTTPYVYSMFAQDTADWLHLPQDEEAFSRIFAMDSPAKQRKAAPKQAKSASQAAQSAKETPKEEPKETPRKETPKQPKQLKEEDDEEVSIEEYDRNTPFGIVMTRNLFDAFINGFDGVVIHGDGGASMDVKLGAWSVASSLFACITEGNDDNDNADPITEEDIKDAWEGIKEIANLTDKAEARWSEAFYRASADYYRGNGCKHWGGLITAMRTFNPTYYESNIKPLLRTPTAVPFEEDTYTFTDFDNDAPICSLIFEKSLEIVL